MCGLLGIISRDGIARSNFVAACKMQFHRGPDDSGEWHGFMDNWQIAIAHQRLSIIDLSSLGAQPMIHPDTGSVLVFNGEIYNFVELKAELESAGLRFYGNSDTEVLLRGLEHWGIEKTLPKLNGMWAIAWIDQRNREIHLSRDRCGEKPLYFSVIKNVFCFASELKSLLTLHDKRQSLNHAAIKDFLSLGLLNTNSQTMISGVDQVEPGVLMTFAFTPTAITPRTSNYWSCATVLATSPSLSEFIEATRQRLLESVRIRLRSDVPVGILLSGGVDSSAIAGAATALNAQNLSFISLVSKDARFDESPFIDRVARHLGKNVLRIDLHPTPVSLFEDLERATWFADAPLNSITNIAQYRLMRAASEAGTTVLLSGQGGDELFCGYRKYLGFFLQSAARRGRLDTVAKTLLAFLQTKTVLNQFSLAEAQRYLPSRISKSTASVYGSALCSIPSAFVGLLPYETPNQRQLRDIHSLSVPTLNHYEDRLGMAWSREIRLPFLDHQLIEQSIGAPQEFKLRNGWTKFALRRAIEPWLPPEIVWRKDKQGFITPEAEWLKNELRKPILKTYLCSNAEVFSRGFLDRAETLRVYDRYCGQKPHSGSIYSKNIFRFIALEAWLRSFGQFIS
jgi:asparagine synthase (glutamine-hydrolysing)